jgi:hypothetical protein
MTKGTLQKSAWDLLELWERNDKATVGDALGLFQIYEMPPWDQICRVMSWQYYLVDGGSFGKRHFGFTGVYRLIALATEGDVSKPATLNRVCGQDESGTLYIGESMDMGRRLNEFRRSTEHRRERSHGTASMLRQITGLNYPVAKLGVALLFTGARTKDIEHDLLWAYMNTFGDTPPLNYRL